MRYSTTNSRARLIMLYNERQRLEFELLQQKNAEKRAGRNVLKGSKVTKYRINSLNKAIRNQERIINHAAEAWEYWDFSVKEVQLAIDNLRDDKATLVTEMEQIKTDINTTQDDKKKQDLGLAWIRKSQQLVLIEKEIKDAEKDLDKLLEKEPQHVGRISAEIVLAQYANEQQREQLASGDCIDIIKNAALRPKEERDAIAEASKRCAGETPDPTDILMQNYSNVHPDLPPDDIMPSFKLTESEDNNGEKTTNDSE